jgi:hypothetical protein
MRNIEKYNDFKKNGYLVIKNAFNHSEIEDLRSSCLDAFKDFESTTSITNENSIEKRQIFSKEFTKNPDILNPLFKKNIIKEIKEIFGEDYISFADFSLNNNTLSPIWHIDAQSIGLRSKYIYNDSFNIAKLGLYLQENDDEYGGQLDIIPGSHLPSFLGANSIISFGKNSHTKISKLQLLAISIRNKFLKKLRLQLEVGDIILFHALLMHRSSQPDWSKFNQIEGYGIENPPADKRKFMFQWEVSENNEFAKFYATHQSKRPANKFQEATNISISDFNASSQKLFQENGVNLVPYSKISLEKK